MAYLIFHCNNWRSNNRLLVVFGCLIFLSLFSSSGSEIHRTRTSRVSRSSAKAYPGSEATGSARGDGVERIVSSGTGDEWTVEKVDLSNNSEYSQTEAWMYAISATVLVGLTGIFPLLLPIEVDPSKHDERGAAKFNCILSFAVGGLLGDVFIHLLPEAWAHIAHDDFAGHLTVGLWVIFGMILFLSIEKVFGEEDERIPLDHEPDYSGSSGSSMQQDEMVTHFLNVRNGEKYSASQNGFEKNGLLRRKPLNSNYKEYQEKSIEEIKQEENGGVSNGTLSQSSRSSSQENGVDAKEKKVKVVGYLNLLANFIDNFTHGIAVAGSFLVSKKVGFLTTAAILLHEVPHEVGDFAILLRSGFTRMQATKSQISTAVGGILGAVVTLLSESAQETGNRAAWILPFTAGGFIHIALSTVLPELLQETSWKESLKQMLCLLSGIAVMAAVSLLVE